MNAPLAGPRRPGEGPREACAHCDGEGEVRCPDCRGTGRRECWCEVSTCRTCHECRGCRGEERVSCPCCRGLGCLVAARGEVAVDAWREAPERVRALVLALGFQGRAFDGPASGRFVLPGVPSVVVWIALRLAPADLHRSVRRALARAGLDRTPWRDAARPHVREYRWANQRDVRVESPDALAEGAGGRVFEGTRCLPTMERERDDMASVKWKQQPVVGDSRWVEIHMVIPNAGMPTATYSGPEAIARLVRFCREFLHGYSLGGSGEVSAALGHEEAQRLKGLKADCLTMPAACNVRGWTFAMASRHEGERVTFSLSARIDPMRSTTNADWLTLGLCLHALGVPRSLIDEAAQVDASKPRAMSWPETVRKA